MSCNKKSDTVLSTPQKGKIVIDADESFKSVMQALTDSYEYDNPSAKINLVIKQEDFGLLDLLNGKADIAVLSRELSPEEKAAYDAKVGLKWQPAKFAGDAVVFVVPQSSELTSISYDEIIKMLESPEENFVFDNTNSSNLNFVAQKINKQPAELQFSVIEGNANLITQLKKFPNKIGVISLNTISRPYSVDAQNLRNDIKILNVVKDGKSYEPSTQNIRNMSYPFTRILYFLTNEKHYGLANGFIRFSCTQLGQLIVEKEGLQPYNIYKREVQMR